MTTDRSPMQPDSAEAWLARLESPECSASERAAFEHWRAHDPANARAYAETEQLHCIAAALAGDPLLRAASLAARRRGLQRTGRRRMLVWLAVPAALAAGVLLVFGASMLRHGDDTTTTQRYANTANQLQVVRLADGTRMVLDADSEVSTRFDDAQRETVLLRGRAEFAVARRAAPFEVSVGANRIRDIGTTFQVSKEGDGVSVGLLEGRVTVTHGSGGQAQTHTLAPDQQIRIAADGSSDGVQPLDAEAAHAWTSGELVFRQRRLDELLVEMNRYSQTKLRLGDPALAALQVSGSFHAGDQLSLVKALHAGWSLQAENSGEHELTLYPAIGQRREN